MTDRITLLAFAALLALIFFSAIGSAYLEDYTYYQDGTLTNSGSEVTDYQIMFVVYTGAGSSSGDTLYLNSHSESDLDDLRFTDTSDTLYTYWIEPGSSPYNVWVKVPTIPAGDSTIRIQYGNPGASAVSSTSTFLSYHGSASSSFHDSNTLPYVNVAFRAKIAASGDINTLVGIGTSSSSDADSILIQTATVTGFVYGRISNDNAYTEVHESPQTSSAIVDGKLLSTSAHYFVNGNEIASGITTMTNAPNTALGLVLWIASGTGSQDWSFARKYNASEPTNTAWSSEAAPPTPTPTPTPTTVTPTPTPTSVPAGTIGVYEYASNYIIWAVGGNQSQITIDGILVNVTNATNTTLYGQYELQAGSTHIGCPLNGTCVIVNLHEDAVSVWLLWGVYLLLIFLAVISYKYPVSMLPALLYGLWLLTVYLPDIDASGTEFVMVGIVMVMSVIMSALGMRKI